MPGLSARPFDRMTVGILDPDLLEPAGLHDTGDADRIVGQIAKIKGCRAVGIAGGAAKCRYIVDELGFDAAIDYKSEDVRKTLRTHCPTGVNVYFDNVGGDILDIALTQLA